MALAKVRAYPLSDADIRKALGSDIRIITNRELGSLRRVDDLFDSQGRAILLYTPEDPTSGHWVCLMKRKDGIYFWDSYGDKPDIAAYLGDQPPLLTQILSHAGVPIHYNTHKYQKSGGSVATCGRWCIARLLYSNLDESGFRSVVGKFKGNPDDFVSGLIYAFIKK